MVFAADVVLREDHPDVYVVQKGDTLWDISARFLKAPWLWPEIWQANPQVENPHLIYPGDRLSLVYQDGRPVLRHDGFGPRVRRERLEDAITAVRLSEIQAFLKRPRMLDLAEIRGMPYVVALEENRLRSTTGQIAYVRGLDVSPGSTVYILRPTFAFYDVARADDDRREQRRPTQRREWSSERGRHEPRLWDDSIPTTWRRRKGEYLGHEVLEIGIGEVLRTGDPQTVLVQYGDYEIKKGDLVTLTPPDPFDLTFYPRAPDSVPENMRVMSFTDALAVVGPKQVVALNKGGRDGVANGQVYAIYQPGAFVRDTVRHPVGEPRTTFRPRRAEVELPEEFVGHVMVFRTFDKISYGLIMDGIRPVHLYDVLRPPVY
ncbi:MAG TPA: LysM peptidoglycan-binding domain-containing protein [Candidatus Saccharimonadia bacterium]|nr:LysM peptidoglycan-binding domain-containing protein [Candidatus Saccharimonadia bacterium]